MTKATYQRKHLIGRGAVTVPEGSRVHDHCGGEHGSRQADMLLKQ